MKAAKDFVDFINKSPSPYHGKNFQYFFALASLLTADVRLVKCLKYEGFM